VVREKRGHSKHASLGKQTAERDSRRCALHEILRCLRQWKAGSEQRSSRKGCERMQQASVREKGTSKKCTVGKRMREQCRACDVALMLQICWRDSQN
jgi:hypothetical protein